MLTQQRDSSLHRARGCLMGLAAGSRIPTTDKFDALIEGDSQEKVSFFPSVNLREKGKNPGIRRKW